MSEVFIHKVEMLLEGAELAMARQGVIGEELERRLQEIVLLHVFTEGERCLEKRIEVVLKRNAEGLACARSITAGSEVLA